MEISALPTLEAHLVAALSTPPTEVRRLFHGRGRCWQGLEQITVDWLQGQVLVSLFKEPSPEFLAELTTLLNKLTETAEWQNSGATSLLLQHRDRLGSPMDVIWGETSEYQDVIESGLVYKLDLGRKQNNGLFLDMRFGRD